MKSNSVAFSVVGASILLVGESLDNISSQYELQTLISLSLSLSLSRSHNVWLSGPHLCLLQETEKREAEVWGQDPGPGRRRLDRQPECHSTLRFSIARTVSSAPGCSSCTPEAGGSSLHPLQPPGGLPVFSSPVPRDPRPRLLPSTADTQSDDIIFGSDYVAVADGTQHVYHSVAASFTQRP